MFFYVLKEIAFQRNAAVVDGCLIVETVKLYARVHYRRFVRKALKLGAAVIKEVFIIGAV